MAKHDRHDVVLVNEGQPDGGVQWMRRDEHFMANGKWYINARCPIHGDEHGMVDEEVSWQEAKTPHHAGVIAESRHIECLLPGMIEVIEQAARHEIDAAEEEVRRMRALIASTKKEVKQRAADTRKANRSLPKSGEDADPAFVAASRLADRAEQEARARLASYEWGLGEALARVAQVRAENTGPRQAPSAHVSTRPRRRKSGRKQ